MSPKLVRNGRVVKTMFILSLLFLTIKLSSYVSGEFGSEECITPVRTLGTCVPITNCEKLLALVLGNRADREWLKTFHCGFQGRIPKVCCTKVSATTAKPVTAPSQNSCRTLESKPGTCVEIKQCPEIAKRLTRPVNLMDLAYVRLSRCSQPSPESVCCEKPTKDNKTDVKLKRYIDNRFFHPNEVSSLPVQNTEQCGEDSSSGNKIIHGEPTLIDQYPWLAIIEYSPIKSNRCAGTLINSLYVVTAAHCVVTRQNYDRGAKYVRLGDYDVTNDGEDCVEVEGGGKDCNNGAITFDIEEIIVHDKYNKKNVVVEANDIALLKLNDTAPFNDFIRPICLPTSDVTIAPPSDLRFSIAGWGTFNESLRGTDMKLHAEVPYVNISVCKRLYLHHNVSIIWNKQICAGGEPDKDSCKGDSGGPLMYLRGHRFELTGIISYGAVECGSKGKPAIHTKIFDYIPWIRKNIEP